MQLQVTSPRIRAEVHSSMTPKLQMRKRSRLSETSIPCRKRDAHAAAKSVGDHEKRLSHNED